MLQTSSLNGVGLGCSKAVLGMYGWARSLDLGSLPGRGCCLEYIVLLPPRFYASQTTTKTTEQEEGSLAFYIAVSPANRERSHDFNLSSPPNAILGHSSCWPITTGTRRSGWCIQYTSLFGMLYLWIQARALFSLPSIRVKFSNLSKLQ